MKETPSPTLKSAPAGRSFAHNSLLRLIAHVARLLFGLATGVMTARWLGSYEKGTLSTLLFAGHVVLFYVCGLGLGDALIILVGRREFTLQRAISASVALLLPACALGIACLWVLGLIADWGAISTAVVLGAVGFVLWVFLSFLLSVLNSEERFFALSSISILFTAASALFTWILVGVLDLGLAGATAAVAAGFAAGLIVAIVVLRRGGITFMPQWDKSFSRAALRIGAAISGSFILIAVSQRFDQLVVYAIAGPASAGQYSVALTVGQLAAVMPQAMSAVAFPRVARLSPADAVDFTGKLTRTGVTIALLCGIPLVFLLPVVVPFVWGYEYTAGIRPAQILVAGGTAWSVQSLLARAAAAQGRTRVLVTSFGLNVGVMLVLDFVLVGSFGIVGAAVASLVGSFAGLVVCIRDFRRNSARATALVPRTNDLVGVVRSVRELWRR